MKVFIINGMARSGKDTFVEFCSKHAKVKNYSSVDYIKIIAQLLGWDGQKDERSRKFLSDLKDLSTEYNDGPVLKMEEQINLARKNGMDFIFLHMREPSEIAKCKKLFNAETIFIQNPNVPIISSNEADKNVFNYDYDYTIVNDGTLEDLERKAEKFISSYLLD